ncbi:hypothetical protein HYDPIDRAFT_110255 [Hydnomerulius pinastri MD-312]|nr:hypothetical protein HYDPIDRAFT_110255 [Hydnomerulius pinastri MD-312]
MYAAKFTVFYVIAAIAALASASPVPIAAADLNLAKREILAREPLAVAEAVVEREPTPEEEDVEARICRFGCL